MLRTNLSTRPFYNTRAVRAALAAVAIVVLGLILFNTVEIVRLNAAQQTLGANEASAKDEAGRLRSQAARIRSQIDRKELETVAAAAKEANSLIDQRAFSWTGLLSTLETTLPADVRIRAIQPKLESGAFIVVISLEARSAEDIDTFIEALEQSGQFRNVLPLVQQSTDDDLLQATVEGAYVAAAQPAEAVQ
jgi:Tfp pilus assembly protein PilN